MLHSNVTPIGVCLACCACNGVGLIYDAMRPLITKLLVLTIVAGSILSAPPVMALSMPMSAQATTSAQNQTGAIHCALCRFDSSDQTPQPAQQMPDCPVAACGVAAAITISPSAAIMPARVATYLLPELTDQMGRLLDGPDPYPPRFW